MDEIEDTNYKFKSQEIENIWYIFFCLSDATFSSVDVSYGKRGPYVLSGETMMSICNTLETIDFCCHRNACNSVQREHNKKLNNGLPILHMIPPYRDYGRYFCIQAGKGGTMRPGLMKHQAHFLYPKQEVLCTWQMIRT